MRSAATLVLAILLGGRGRAASTPENAKLTGSVTIYRDN
jgi:hypothetical protein